MPDVFPIKDENGKDQLCVIGAKPSSALGAELASMGKGCGPDEQAVVIAPELFLGLVMGGLNDELAKQGGNQAT